MDHTSLFSESITFLLAENPAYWSADFHALLFAGYTSLPISGIIYCNNLFNPDILFKNTCIDPRKIPGTH